MSEPDPAPPRSVLCLGEALVDLICEQHLEPASRPEHFSAHSGGVGANVATLTARAGVVTSLAGGVGDDYWGRWLADELWAAGVDTARFQPVAGMRTPLALVRIDLAGDAAYDLYAESPGTVAAALGADVTAAVAEHGALFITSNTLVSPAEREVTMAARAAALELKRPIIFDPNLRLHRWSSRTDAAASVNAAIRGVTLLRLNAEEAAILTGEADVERAAVALRKTGAANVVISLGADGAILRGRINADVPGVDAGEMLSSVGCGDAMTATLIAKLVQSDFYEPVIAAGLRDAVRAGALATRRWGAVD